MDINTTYQNPNFICIGLEKTGTTWLYKILQNHPQVFIPYKKEIRFFWEKTFLPNNNIFRRFTSSHFHNRGIRRYLLVSAYFAVKNLITFNKDILKRLTWDIRFLFFPHSYRWYASLFEIYPEKNTGEITALTYTIPEEEIRLISQKFPDLKIIILFRHPVDRAWSKAKMKLCTNKNKNFEEISKEQWYEVFQEEFDACPSYFDLVNRWEKYFPKDRIHLSFYEKLQTNPLSYLQEICDFLALDINDFPDHVIENLDKKINRGLDQKIPDFFYTYLSRLYDNCIKEMSYYHS